MAAVAAAAMMASSSSTFTPVAATRLLLLCLLLVGVAPPPVLLAADGTTHHLHLFMHDVVSGSNATAVRVVTGPAGGRSSSLLPGAPAFGDTSVIDDVLTETSSPASAAVGRAQGMYMLSSQSGFVLTVSANLVLTAGEYNGSTIAMMGRDDVGADVRELAVVGGTGRFRMAAGYVLWKTASASGPDATIELDVYVTTSRAAAGGSGGGGGGGGGWNDSAAAARNGRWVSSACAVAVLAAVVGSSFLFVG